MKKIITILLTLWAFVATLNAQVPNQFNYQAVARNSSGQNIPNANIRIRISILDGSATATSVYSETRQATTNQLGLFTLAIGGTGALSTTGNFATIDWSTGKKFIKVEVDPLGGSSFVELGNTELLSVPYALYSVNGKVGPAGPPNILNIDTITTGAVGSSATATITGTAPAQTLNLSIPTGATGATGPQGSIGLSNILSVGTVTTGVAGSPASASITGTSPAQILNLTLPTGAQGPQGIQGIPGVLTGVASGDLSGNYPAPTVIKLQGKDIANTAPTNGQQLVYNTTTYKWEPTTITAANNAWNLTCNAGTTAANFIGTTDNNPLQFKVNNLPIGRLDTTNTFLGFKAGIANTTWQYNLGIGRRTLLSNTTGGYNVALGDSALGLNTIGQNNTATGIQSLYSNIDGSQNLAYGNYAFFSNTSGYNNVGIGFASLLKNTDGYDNAANGNYALYSNTNGYDNAANGNYALYSNTGGAYNTANGSHALYSNTVGVSNTANGYYALGNNTIGNKNIAIGDASLYSNISGDKNVAIGFAALTINTAGSENVANGFAALNVNSTGSYNVANGSKALSLNTTGTENVANGFQALYSNRTGSENIATGSSSLYSIITGSFNTAIGFQAGEYVPSNLSNTTCVGNGSGFATTVSNEVNIGNTSIVWIGGQKNWSTYSDARIKDDIQNNVPGLNFINQLRPVTYHINLNNENALLNDISVAKLKATDTIT